MLMKMAFLLICEKMTLKTLLIQKAIVTSSKSYFVGLNSLWIYTFEYTMTYLYNEAKKGRCCYEREVKSPICG